MATLALPPTAATLPAQEDPHTSEKPSADDSAADPSDIDSGWVFLGKSDVVPAELAAAAVDAAGRRRLGFSPLPMLPIWVQMVLGGVVYTAVPFYKRARQIEGRRGGGGGSSPAGREEASASSGEQRQQAVASNSGQAAVGRSKD